MNALRRTGKIAHFTSPDQEPAESKALEAAAERQATFLNLRPRLTTTQLAGPGQQQDA